MKSTIYTNKENNKKTLERVLLISMPFVMLSTPSIQLGALKSYLESRGIPVDVHHAYLRCADILGQGLYDTILLRCGVGSEAHEEFLYHYFLYPENFNNYRKEIEYFFYKITQHKYGNLDTALERLKTFNNELLNSIEFSKYSLVGFTVTYDQLKPSLYIARQIKLHYPHIKTVFGGGNCVGELGKSQIKTFPEIDFVISHEGEEALSALVFSLKEEKFNDVKGLIWRDKGSVKFNGPQEPLPLDKLPVPDYDDFFNQVEKCSFTFKKSIKDNMTIPVEGSRGCWWNKCTFCNLNMQFSGYREKPVEKIVSEIEHQTAKYECCSIHFLDNVHLIKGFEKLMLSLKGVNKDLSIFLEIRAGHLQKTDYKLMQEAGVKVVQIGIESFSNKALKKLNKGTTVIQNVAALKYCQEYGIFPYYGIIYNYPDEIPENLKETSDNVQFLKYYVPPVDFIPLRLFYQTPYYCNSEKLNILEKQLPKTSLWSFPEEIRKTLISFSYDYVCVDDRRSSRSSWVDVFIPWFQTAGDRLLTPLLFYQNGGDFLILIDKLTKERKTLRGIEHKIYLFCESIQSKSNILKSFSNISSENIENFLDEMVAKRWMYREGEKFLSLAVRLNPTMNSLLYVSLSYLINFNENILSFWKPPKPRWRSHIRLGSVANINISLSISRKPAWLKSIKDKVEKTLFKKGKIH